jgi:hypothetical protein
LIRDVRQFEGLDVHMAMNDTPLDETDLFSQTVTLDMSRKQCNATTRSLKGLHRIDSRASNPAETAVITGSQP